MDSESEPKSNLRPFVRNEKESNRRGQSHHQRQLVWVVTPNFKGFGCSVCDWVFNPSGDPVGESLEEMKRNFELERDKQFAAHQCSDRKT
jgi:rubredoxin